MTEPNLEVLGDWLRQRLAAEGGQGVGAPVEDALLEAILVLQSAGALRALHETTQQEDRLASHTGVEHPAQRVQVELAAGVSRLIGILGTSLPQELAMTIAQSILEFIPDMAMKGCRKELCSCFEGSPCLTLDAASSPARAACAACGALSRLACIPRLPRPGGGSWSMRGVRLECGDGAWKTCPCACRGECAESRHFQFDEAGRSLAVRHRMSGFHSFRTVVSDEWVLGGMVSYKLSLETLRPPCAIAVGVVTPKAQVNCDTAWAAGTRSWEHAWGYCTEGFIDIPNQQRAIDEHVTFGGLGSMRIAPVDGCPLPSPVAGDVISVMLGNGHFTMELGQVHMDLRLPPTPDGKSWPLALAVALKYSGDAVGIRRV